MNIRINEYGLKTPKITTSFDTIVISDIHSNIKALKEVKKILSSKTKYILIPGDTIDHINSNGNDNLKDELNLLSKYANVVISLGNHDSVNFVKKSIIYNKEIPTSDLSFFKQLEKETNCFVMTNSFNSINIDKDISINALNVPVQWYQNGENREDYFKFISTTKLKIDKRKLNILLSHSPNAIIKNNKLGDKHQLILEKRRIKR